MASRDETQMRILGSTLADVQDRLLEQEVSKRHEAGYRRFLRTIDQRQQSASSSWLIRISFAGAGLAAAAALLLLIWMAYPNPDTLTFKVGKSQIAGEAGRWIIAPDNEDMPIRFSDGTRIDLTDRSRARIHELNGNGAQIILESGTAKLNVIHQRHTLWMVAAGPFEVRVTGTAFVVHWAPDEQFFSLALKEGSVEVQGPVLDNSRLVRKGQTLRVSVQHEVALLSNSNSVTNQGDWIRSLHQEKASSSAEKEIEKHQDQEAGRQELTKKITEKQKAQRRSSSDLNWIQLADEGKYEKALAQAERMGIDRLYQRLGPAELLRLAEVARFSGRTDRAEQALLVLRKRFPKRRESSIAAYTLGRTAFDQQGAYAKAARWFDVYIQEQPTGPLAREALGRLMEAQQRAGWHTQARATAIHYLKQYPNGPHADIASRLTTE